MIHKISSISESSMGKKSRSTIPCFRSLPLSLAHEETLFFSWMTIRASVLVVDEKQVEKNSIILTFHIRRWINIFLTIQAHERWENHNNILTRTFTHKQSREKYCTLRKLLILVRKILSIFPAQRRKVLSQVPLSRSQDTEWKIFYAFFLKLPLCRISFYGYLLVVLHFMKVLLFVYPLLSFLSKIHLICKRTQHTSGWERRMRNKKKAQESIEKWWWQKREHKFISFFDSTNKHFSFMLFLRSIFVKRKGKTICCLSGCPFFVEQEFVCSVN